VNHPEITTPFRKSSHSGGAANDCVEVAATANGGAAVRDTKHRSHGTQHHSPTAWAAFLSALKVHVNAR
jgi:hypothetical protein